MMYELPTTLEVNGTQYEIRSDYRVALDIIIALNDDDLADQDRGEAVLYMLFPAFSAEDETMMPAADYEEAIKAAMLYINGGEEDDGVKRPKQMDWEQDFPLIINPINRVAGCEVRAVPYMHWYTFLSYFKEIGDCLFAQVVAARDKIATGKKMDKQDREFYKRNQKLIDFKRKYTEQDAATFAAWGVK